MSQANPATATIAESNKNLEVVTDKSKISVKEEIPITIEIPKSTKSTTRRTSERGRKKPYTEDSIRIYLQEIGRIRLLRAEEEIELARKIADLLELERIREGVEESLEREITDADGRIDRQEIHE